MIREANHFVYIENQFFISNTKESGPVKNQIAAALVERIVSAARSGKKFKASIGDHVSSPSNACPLFFRSL